MRCYVRRRERIREMRTYIYTRTLRCSKDAVVSIIHLRHSSRLRPRQFTIVVRSRTRCPSYFSKFAFFASTRQVPAHIQNTTFECDSTGIILHLHQACLALLQLSYLLRCRDFGMSLTLKTK